MSDLKFGVVIASYNGEKYIQEQLQSIVEQSVPVREIVISDDGSSDETKNIINDFILLHPEISIKLVDHIPSGFISENFYNAIALLDSVDYVFFSDQDDKWITDKVKYFSEAIKEMKFPDLVFSDAFVVNSDMSIQRESLIKELGSKLYKDLINTNKYFEFYPNYMNCKRILKWNIVTGMNTCIKYSFFKSLRKLPSGVLHDRWLMLNAFFSGRLCYLPIKTAFYRQHSNNVVGVQKKKSIIEKRKSMCGYLNRMEKYYDALFFLTSNSFGKDIKAYNYVAEYSNFYKRRLNYLREKKFANIVKEFLGGGYTKYTYNWQRQLLNDFLFCILCRT